MVTIKEATRNAMAFAQEALGSERTQGMRLEEIESATEGPQQVWYITLSMFDPSVGDHGVGGTLAAILEPKQREYKRFTVLKDTGEVTSMKIRELSNA